MSILEMIPPTLIRDLGDGLVMRHASPADADALAEFNSRIHSDDGPDQPDEGVAAWTRDLLTRPHPTMAPGDFTLVEESATGRIVSSLNLIPQTWAYDGVPFGVGRPEAVGTRPEYRRRGLVRAQFEEVHRWSLERGHLAQAITGIPYYYRQFGYEMALDLEAGRSGYAPQVPQLKDDQAEPVSIRPATEADLGFIAELYEQTVGQREPVTCVRDAAIWRYELDGRSSDFTRNELRVIEADGEPVGYLAHTAKVWTGKPGVRVVLVAYELGPGASWVAATPSVIRYLWQTGEAYAARQGQTLQRFAFGLGAEHPAYVAFPNALPSVRPPYAWYVRVPDLAGFLRHVTPALDERLARSLAAGHSGEVKLSFYRSGLRLVLERGRLTGIEPWQPRPEEEGSAGFPDLTFLQLVFGRRTPDELREAFADVWFDGDTTRALLMALFPKRPSNVWAVA